MRDDAANASVAAICNNPNGDDGGFQERRDELIHVRFEWFRRVGGQGDEKVRDLLHHRATSIADLRDEHVHRPAKRRVERRFENIGTAAERDRL